MLDVVYQPPLPRSVMVREEGQILASALYGEGKWDVKIEIPVPGMLAERLSFVLTTAVLGPSLPDNRVADILRALVMGYRQLGLQGL